MFRPGVETAGSTAEAATASQEAPSGRRQKTLHALGGRQTPTPARGLSLVWLSEVLRAKYLPPNGPTDRQRPSGGEKCAGLIQSSSRGGSENIAPFCDVSAFIS